MNTASLTRVTCLEEMLSAEKEREKLILRVRELDMHLSELRRLLPAKASPNLPRPRRVSRTPRRPHGTLRKQIMDALESAQGKGVHAKALAAQIGVEQRLLHGWLSVYVKRIPGLSRVGPGVFAYVKPR